jgi:citrate synthase
VEFRPGLEGVVAAQTEISDVDGENGRLIYRGGYLIEELADRRYEEVAHLLWTGILPDPEHLADLRAQLASCRGLNQQATAALRGLGPDVDPLDALRTGLSAQGAQANCPHPTLKAAIAYTAVLPTIVAAFYRQSRGQEWISPRPDLNHAANFLWMMTGREPTAEQTSWLETYLVLLADHGLNASTFTARVVASTGADLCSALVGAISALKGPAHGGAATASLQMLSQLANPEAAEQFVHDRLASGQRLMGFGHRVYRTYDPRARILREVAERVNPRFFAIASSVEKFALQELLARHPERPNATNVDYYSAGVLEAVGFPAEYFTCVFAAARVAGWAAHVLEYTARDGRIIRPASQWVGPDPDQR